MKRFALAVVLLAGCAPSAPARDPNGADTLLFRDDFAQAQSAAKAKHVELVVMSEVSYSHASLALRAELEERGTGGRVWLTSDVERPSRASELVRLASPSVPTIWIVDPQTGAARFKWVGFVSEPRQVLPTDENDRWSKAGKAWAEGRLEEAATTYRALVSSDRVTRPAVRALLAVLDELGETEECVTTALRHATTRSPNEAPAIVAAGLACAASAPRRAPEDALLSLVDRGSALSTADLPNTPFEERVELFERVHHALTRVNEEDATKLARLWVQRLEAHAQNASPKRRSIYDGVLLALYLELRTPQRAVAMAEASERAFPSDFNHPARLARALLAMQRYEEAVAASDRSLVNAYGPRGLYVRATKVDALVGAGKRAEAKKVLLQAVELARTLPLDGEYALLRAKLEVMLAEWRRD